MHIRTNYRSRVQNVASFMIHTVSINNQMKVYTNSPIKVILHLAPPRFYGSPVRTIQHRPAVRLCRQGRLLATSNHPTKGVDEASGSVLALHRSSLASSREGRQSPQSSSVGMRSSIFKVSTGCRRFFLKVQINGSSKDSSGCSPARNTQGGAHE